MQITTDAFSTLRKADGIYLTFHTEYPGGTNLSTGVVMTSFTANGAVIGTPKTVVADPWSGPPQMSRPTPKRRMPR